MKNYQRFADFMTKYPALQFQSVHVSQRLWITQLLNSNRLENSQEFIDNKEFFMKDPRTTIIFPENCNIANNQLCHVCNNNSNNLNLFCCKGCEKSFHEFCDLNFESGANKLSKNVGVLETDLFCGNCRATFGIEKDDVLSHLDELTNVHLFLEKNDCFMIHQNSYVPNNGFLFKNLLEIARVEGFLNDENEFHSFCKCLSNFVLFDKYKNERASAPKELLNVIDSNNVVDCSFENLEFLELEFIHAFKSCFMKNLNLSLIQIEHNGEAKEISKFSSTVGKDADLIILKQKTRRHFDLIKKKQNEQ